MIKIITVIALTLTAAPLRATTIEETCAAMGGLAVQIMTIRQQGTAMSTTMAVVTKNVEPPYTKIISDIIINAYSVPRFSGAEYRERAIADFRNRTELGCYTALGG